jgi:integrase
VTGKSAPIFEKVTRDCYDTMKGDWKDQQHASWMSSFERHVFPHIGGKAVTVVDSAAVLSLLEPIWLTIPDTAKRVLQRIGTVLDYAHIKGLAALPSTPGRDTLRRTMLTAARSNETRKATWGELDLDKTVCSIPARMKMKEAHVVPLAPLR